MAGIVTITEVKNVIIPLRGEEVILDADVAKLYGVATREINQAVKNNPEKFPEGFIFTLDTKEIINWRSKNLITNISPKARYLPKAFTERGIYVSYHLEEPYSNTDYLGNCKYICTGERGEKTNLRNACHAREDG